MVSCCLICSSKAVLTKDVANAAVMMIGTITSFLRGIHDVPADPPIIDDEDLLERVARGVASSLAGHTDTLAFATDLQKYQFNGYGCLCLRCGAQFDQAACLIPT